ALHVDIPEQDAVKGVVQHYIQPLHRPHGGDLRHTETGAIIAKADVTAHLFPHFVQTLAHQTEVFLSGVGTAKPFPGRPVGDIVDQALPGAADHRHDIRSLASRGLPLDDVFIDIPGGYDHIEIGLPPLPETADLFL